MLRIVSFLLAATLTGAASAQILIMPDTTSNTLVSFNPIDGSLLNTNLFSLQGGTMISAVDVNGEIWVSEQLGDRVSRWDANGNLLGNIGPTFTGGGLDNVRGLSVINGLVYVTSSGTQNGAPGPVVQVFDPAGNFVFGFSTTGLAPSPFSVLSFQGDVLVASSSANDDVHRFTVTGTSVGTFHNTASISFAHQIALASDGNVWCAAFTTGSVFKLDQATGNVLDSFPASGARGVFELFNGNVMWTNSSGAWVYDVASQTSTLVHAGGGRHLNLYGVSGTNASATPYGVGCDGLTFAANGLPQIGNPNFSLTTSNVPAISPFGFVAFGSAVVNPGIDLTGVGMPGCFSYTSFDLGLFAGQPVVAGSSVFALPIPADPTLNGTNLASQAVTLSLATPALLASSNGVALTIAN